jgi:hypothetical protein
MDGSEKWDITPCSLLKYNALFATCSILVSRLTNSLS